MDGTEEYANKNVGCKWELRSKVEKILSFVLMVSLLILVILMCIIVVLQSEKQNLCLTNDCIISSARLLSSIDNSIDPCENFFKYTCGKFVENQAIANISGEALTAKLKALKRFESVFLETPKATDSMAQKNLHYIYSSCMNKSLINQGDKYLKQLLLGGLGGWPLITTNWDNTKFNWINSIVTLSNLGFRYDMFFTLSTFENHPNNNTYLMLKPPFLDQQVFSAHFRKSNENFLKSTVQYFGSQPNYEDINAISDFTAELIKISARHQQNPLDKYSEEHLISLKELQKASPTLVASWCRSLTEITGYHLNQKQLLVANVSSYFKDLNILLKKTPRKVQANYILWEALKDMYMWFNVPNAPRSNLKARQKLCIKETNKILPLVANKILSERVSKKERHKVFEMVRIIKDELRMMLVSNQWMAQGFKEFALGKLQRIEEFISGEFSNLDLKLPFASKESIYEENIILAVIRTRRAVDEFYFHTVFKGSTQDLIALKLLAKDHEAEVHYLEDNYIVLGSGLFQFPIFSLQLPDNLNFAILGHLIGYELAKAFFSAIKKFQELPKEHHCLMDSYQKYIFDDYEIVINRSAIPEETIALIWGTYGAFRASMKYDEGNESKLPGFEYRMRLFWISLARYYCGDPLESYDSWARTTQQDNNIHALPLSFRIYAPIANSDYFAKAFNCPIGSNSKMSQAIGKCPALL